MSGAPEVLEVLGTATVRALVLAHDRVARRDPRLAPFHGEVGSELARRGWIRSPTTARWFRNGAPRSISIREALEAQLVDELAWWLRSRGWVQCPDGAGFAQASGVLGALGVELDLDAQAGAAS